MLLSILIPVYNAEPYLRYLLDNLIAQADSDMEIILCNDGSRDRSLEECNRYRSMYPNLIKVITRENRGAVYTRRELVEASAGDWIWIIDSDDNIAENAISFLKEKIMDSNIDMIIFNYFVTNGKKVCEEKNYPFLNGQIFEQNGKKELYKYIISNSSLNMLWNKVFRRNCYDFDADYTELYDVKKANDCLQLLPIITNADKVQYIDTALYYYNVDNISSLSHLFKEYTYTSLKKVCKVKLEYASKWGEEFLSDYYVFCCKVGCSLLTKYAQCREYNKEDFEKLFHKMINDGVFSVGIYEADLSKLPKETRLITKKARAHDIKSVERMIWFATIKKRMWMNIKLGSQRY